MRFLFRLGWIQILLLHCNCHNSNNNVQNESDTALFEIQSNLNEKSLDVVNYGIIIHGDTSILSYKTIAQKRAPIHIKNIIWKINNSPNNIESKKEQLGYDDFLKQITFLTRKIATKQSFDSLQYLDVDLSFINNRYSELDSISQIMYDEKLSEVNNTEKLKSIILSSTFVSDINRLFYIYRRRLIQTGEAKIIIYTKNGLPQIGGTFGFVIGKSS
jgi:hypothetical protein